MEGFLEEGETLGTLRRNTDATLDLEATGQSPGGPSQGPDPQTPGPESPIRVPPRHGALTCQSRGEDALRHSDSVLRHLGPVTCGPPALHGEADVRGSTGRELMDAEDYGGGPMTRGSRDRQRQGDTETESVYMMRSLGSKELGSGLGGSGPPHGLLTAQGGVGAWGYAARPLPGAVSL